MSEAQKTIREIVDDAGIDVPGSDFARTLVFILFPLALLFLLTDNPALHLNIDELQPYRRVSALLLFSSIGLAVGSYIAVDSVQETRLKDLNRYASLFWGKILIGLAVLFFFAVICGWVILLGGIISSPFASALSMSPILLTIQLFRDRELNYRALYKNVGTRWASKKGMRAKNTHILMTRLVFILGLSPIVLVITTLIFGQACVSFLEAHKALLGTAYEKIVSSSWYFRVFFATYYLSVFIAVCGVLPRSFTTRLTHKVF